MLNINALSLALQKIWARLKFLWRTERTEGRTDEWDLMSPRFREAGDTNWVSIPTFIINEYKSWLSTLLVFKTARAIIVLQKCYQNAKCSFPNLYIIGHQVQCHFHLDKSMVSWIESLIHVTTQCFVLCPYGSLSNIENAWHLFHCKSCIVVLSIYIRTLFYFKVEDNKLILRIVVPRPETNLTLKRSKVNANVTARSQWKGLVTMHAEISIL